MSSEMNLRETKTHMGCSERKFVLSFLHKLVIYLYILYLYITLCYTISRLELEIKATD